MYIKPPQIQSHFILAQQTARNQRDTLMMMIETPIYGSHYTLNTTHNTHKLPFWLAVIFELLHDFCPVLSRTLIQFLPAIRIHTSHVNYLARKLFDRVYEIINYITDCIDVLIYLPHTHTHTHTQPYYARFEAFIDHILNNNNYENYEMKFKYMQSKWQSRNNVSASSKSSHYLNNYLKQFDSDYYKKKIHRLCCVALCISLHTHTHLMYIYGHHTRHHTHLPIYTIKKVSVLDPKNITNTQSHIQKKPTMT